jgi:hypothetical protein
MSVSKNFLSGERFNKLCDISIYTRDYLKICNLYNYINNIVYIGEKNNIDFEKKNIFFTKMDFIMYFINEILPHIKYPFILVTHNSDLPSGNIYQIINHPLLVKWYGQNMIVTSYKTECIPIGLENSIWKRTNPKTIENYKNNNKNKLLYLNFNINTNKNRSNIMEMLLKKGFTKNENKQWDEYIKELSEYKFAISPNGNGIDCHRTWECLYLGVIPIVENTNTMKHFSDLPILFVDNYDIISTDYLEKKFEEFKNKTFNYDKLNIDYWRNKISFGRI